MEIEEQSLTVVLAEEEEGACEQRQLCQQCWATGCQCHCHIPCCGQVLLCTTNKLWSLACHSISLFFQSIQFLSIFCSPHSPPSYHITGKIHFQYQINSNCQGCFSELLFHTLFVFLLLWVAATRSLSSINPFKFRIWCRILTEVIIFLLTVLVTSSWALWFYCVGNTLNWKNPRTPQLSCSSSLITEFVLSLSPGYLVVWSIDL